MHKKARLKLNMIQPIIYRYSAKKATVTLDLFDNPVGYLTSPAVFRLKPCKTAIFSGSCSETEVSKQLYCCRALRVKQMPRFPLGGKDVSSLSNTIMAITPHPSSGNDRDHALRFGRLREFFGRFWLLNETHFVKIPHLGESNGTDLEFIVAF
jgi:hypothetical protein